MWGLSPWVLQLSLIPPLQYIRSGLSVALDFSTCSGPFGGQILWCLSSLPLGCSTSCMFHLFHLHEKDCISLPFRITAHDHSLAKMALVWILPMVTLIVASLTGSLLANAMCTTHATHLATMTTAVSFTSLIMGLSLALMIITIYLTRLVLHGPPDVHFAPSVFMVLGPLGQGGFSLLINGQNLSKLLLVHLGNNLSTAAFTG